MSRKFYGLAQPVDRTEKLHTVMDEKYKRVSIEWCTKNRVKYLRRKGYILTQTTLDGLREVLNFYSRNGYTLKYASPDYIPYYNPDEHKRTLAESFWDVSDWNKKEEENG